MNKEFIPYKQALALKELGFDGECLAIYYKDDNPKELLFSIEEKYSSNPKVAKHQARNAIRNINFEKGWAIKVPLYQQAFRWFREKHGLHSYIEGAYPWFRFYINSEDNRWEGHKYLLYKKAELACLKKLIEIIKTK